MPTFLTPARRVGLPAALLVFAADQACKAWLIHGFDIAQSQPVVLGPFLNIVMAWNPGISYSLFTAESETGRLILLGVTLAATAFLAGWLWLARDRLTGYGLGLLVGGALGNACDRFAYGRVADFFQLHIGAFSPFGVFNLADTAIVAGVGLLLYKALFPGPPQAAWRV